MEVGAARIGSNRLSLDIRRHARRDPDVTGIVLTFHRAHENLQLIESPKFGAYSASTALR